MIIKKENKVFIATSIDGYIADINGGIDWLHSIPNPENTDMGYNAFIENLDALVMGRTTFETVCGFDMEWPYLKPVFVLSNTLEQIPEEYLGKAFLMNGPLNKILDQIHQRGYFKLYIDGGTTIQHFLSEDLIDEMIITIIPILLGSGTSLFGELPNRLEYKCVSSKIFLGSVVQNHFVRSKIKGQ